VRLGTISALGDIGGEVVLGYLRQALAELSGEGPEPGFVRVY
jgi:hypothetical protein